MSFLAPLYALGLLAIAGPFLFHLIRRRPKGEVPFSSLLFLTPSPPPPARRRRLEQILLLLLRAAALVLLGLAFMRPFFRQDTAADTATSGQRIVVLIDTSASIRRGDLWHQAVAKAEAAITACSPSDQIALLAFDHTVRPILSFTESDQLEPQQRPVVARDRLNRLTPTWGGTELGRALIESVGAILESDAKGTRRTGSVVLVSDLTQGARLTGLIGFEWPADVTLELKTVSDDRGNAGLSLLMNRADQESTSDSGPLRIRIVNDAIAQQEQYRLAWDGAAGADIEAYVPPGESRVVKVPRLPNTAGASILRLRGDAFDFDNALYFAEPQREEMTVVFLGTDAADDPNGLLYFLHRAWGETPERIVTVRSHKPDEVLTRDEIRTVPLVVLAGELSAENVRTLERYLRDGGTVLAVLTRAGLGGPVASLAGVPSLTVTEAEEKSYAMLREIAFEHPLFAPLSGPQYGDFTKVHFWKHRRVEEKQLAGARVIAQFDGGDPAVIEKTWDHGRLIVLTAGWQPTDSQLARSSKFVPLMSALIDLRGGKRSPVVNLTVGDRVPLRPADLSPTTTVRKPDGTIVSLPANAVTFDGTDQPGVYVLNTPTGPKSFAVNRDATESLTTPMPAETLEQFGCRMTKRTDADQVAKTERQLRNAELERSQSIWRGLILAALVVLLVETGLAAWRSRAPREEIAS
jgi:hypothetical protein